MKSKIQYAFIIIALSFMILPFLLAHHSIDRISEQENRLYANFPSFLTEDGEFNSSFSTDFDAWIDDNIRFRTIFMEINANIQYHLFHRLAKDDEYIGLENELFLLTSDKILLLQQQNFLTDEDVALYCNKMQGLNDYLTKKNIQFYYMQCYNKETIYPEKYIPGIISDKHAEEAKLIAGALNSNTQVKVVPVYENLIKEKDNTRLFYKVKDPGHWNDSGAFLGYCALINSISDDMPNIRKPSVNDYILGMDDDFRSIYGMRYPYPEESQTYTIKNPQAVEYRLADENPDFNDLIHYKDHTHYYKNTAAGNDYKILMLGDSFIRQSIKDDIAEHFAETLNIDWANITQLEEILAIYQPDIVLLESAENFLHTTVGMVKNLNYN